MTLGHDADSTAAKLRALIPAPESVREDVERIIATVRRRGDAALLEYTKRFDTQGAQPLPPVVDDQALEEAVANLDPAVRHAIDRAIENLEAASVGWRAEEHTPRGGVQSAGQNIVITRHAPVARAAIYVPGGRAPYPSTVIMGTVPARMAGVEHIAVCAPPRDTGDVDATILAACRLVGATAVYRMGGAQAIAALAYGTESVLAVDVIVGPGNLYVQEAKRQVFGQVGIDGFAGPSDLLAIATAGADPEPLALDLLAQAEHGPGTLVVAVSDDPGLLVTLTTHLNRAPETGAATCAVQVPDPEYAVKLAEAFAPEHLQLVGPAAEQLAPRVTRAGCLFVGAGAGTAFGDYIVGSNHILPTNGAARFASGLSPHHFTRRFSEVRIGDPDELARSSAPLARAEGFELHARSMEARLPRQ